MVDLVNRFIVATILVIDGRHQRVGQEFLTIIFGRLCDSFKVLHAVNLYITGASCSLALLIGAS